MLMTLVTVVYTNNHKLISSIHPLSSLRLRFQLTGFLETITAVDEQDAEKTLDKLVVFHMATAIKTHIHIYAQFKSHKSQTNLSTCLWTLGWAQSTWRKTTQAPGEGANLTQKGTKQVNEFECCSLSFCWWFCCDCHYKSEFNCYFSLIHLIHYCTKW